MGFITDMRWKEQKAEGLVITLRNALLKQWILASLLVLLFVSSAVILRGFRARADFPEYQSYVHDYATSGVLGNWTYVQKPMFPVRLNDSQVLVGQNWSIVCPLRANHSYHVYCYGKWVNNGSEPKTDYDVYVYDPLGEIEGYHTESAGLPEHLGTAVNEPFFTPKLSGNYTFVVNNDPRESKGAQEATFIIIEDVACNAWHEHYVEGKSVNNSQVFNTSWAYEFYTESQRIEVYVKVPDMLDMYEARLYLMGNPDSRKGAFLNQVPLAWELGLYGNKSDKFGGYNLESKEDRGLAYASCEYFGQAMFLNFTSPVKGASLYHLVLIGEAGSGTVQFLVKTEFGKACLKPVAVPSRGYAGNDTVIAYASNSTDLINATLRYSTSGWRNATSVTMEIFDDRTCRAIIPAQTMGASVSYRVEAGDVLENILRASDEYPVKHPSTLNVSLPRKAITVGENLTVKGYITPAFGDIPITVILTTVNKSLQVVGRTFENGTFVASCRLEVLGKWDVQAIFTEDSLRYGAASPQLTVQVEEPSFMAKYSLYIGGGAGAAAMFGVVVYLKKFRD